MSVVLAAVGLVLVALPGALGPLGARLAPSEWCRAVLACLRVGRVALHASLAFVAAPLALGAAGAHEMAHACHRSVTAGLPVPRDAGWLAVLALVGSAAHAVRARRREAAALGRLRAEPWLGHHHVEDGVDVAVVPSPAGLAYAVPGRPDQVVLSDGLLAGLDDDEARAVLRHERAHLRHRHHAALAVARDVGLRLRWFPPARASAAALRLAVERWADEDAGGASATARPALRRALVKTIALGAGPVPAFSDACTVAARLRALDAAPPDPSVPVRLAATGPMLGLCALVLGGLAACAVVAHRGVDGLLGRCLF